MNTFGNIYRLTSFGESHGLAMGGVIDGLPARHIFDLDEIKSQLERRRPGSSPLASQRKEADELRLLSGIMGYDTAAEEIIPFDDRCTHVISLGTPVGFMIANTDARSSDYDALRHVYRPSHADYAWDARYGGIRDWRGGGRSSGRETVSRVVAGAFARQILQESGISIATRITSIDGIADPDEKEIERILADARQSADSVGGILQCVISGVPAGTGEPVFGKLQQMLASAMLSIGGVKGFEYGMGFAGVNRRGSEVADEFTVDDQCRVRTLSNHSGGIQGGISNGEEIVFRVAVKPTPSIARELHTVTDDHRPTTVKTTGRHDPAILLRIPPVVEAMAAMTLLDARLMRSTHV